MIWLLLIGMTFLGALGGLSLKLVSNVAGVRRKLACFSAGCVAYGLGAILNVVELRYLPYTVVFPLTSFTYVWTFILSSLILREKMNWYKTMGLVCILTGAYLIVQ